MDESLAQEGADWIAEQVSEDLGGFIPSELVDRIMELEVEVRAKHDDPDIDHKTMTGYLITLLTEEGVPVKEGAVTPMLVEEILHWEDEFRGLAGVVRNVRPS